MGDEKLVVMLARLYIELTAAPKPMRLFLRKRMDKICCAGRNKNNWKGGLEHVTHTTKAHQASETSLYILQHWASKRYISLATSRMVPCSNQRNASIPIQEYDPYVTNSHSSVVLSRNQTSDCILLC